MAFCVVKPLDRSEVYRFICRGPLMPFPDEKSTHPKSWYNTVTYVDDPSRRKTLYMLVGYKGCIHSRAYDDEPMREREAVGICRESIDTAQYREEDCRNSNSSPLLVHTACLSVFKRFAAYRQTLFALQDISLRPPQTVRELSTCDRGIRTVRASPWLLKNPDDNSIALSVPSYEGYYVGQPHQIPPKQPGWDYEGLFFGEDPLTIPNMTQSLLGQLRPATNPVQETVSFKERLESLPAEIYGHVIDFVLDDFAISSVQGFLPQQCWKHMIVSGRLFPFLWDLDPEVCEKFDGAKLDWELLARLIAQDDLDPAKPSPLPPGLRNRKRIWRNIGHLRSRANLDEGNPDRWKDFLEDDDFVAICG